MLLGPAIRDIVLIERLDLRSRPGAKVLTGETGAGKSILPGALGARAAADSLIQGQRPRAPMCP